MFKKLGRGLATLGAMAAGAYVLFIRPWHLRWAQQMRKSSDPCPVTTRFPTRS